MLLNMNSLVILLPLITTGLSRSADIGWTSAGPGVELRDGPTKLEGNVYVNGQPVCDDHWDLADATVICRMLGLGVSKATTGRQSKYNWNEEENGLDGILAHFNESQIMWAMNNVECEGTELSIHECPHQEGGFIGCKWNKMAGAVCKEDNPTGVNLQCGTTLTLSEEELPTVTFSNVPGKCGACNFTIEAPKDFHVELSCDSPFVTANGRDAANFTAGKALFTGEGPVVIEFLRTEGHPQLTCRAGLEEAHMEPITNNDIGIDEFDHSCHKTEATMKRNGLNPADKERRERILAERQRRVRELNTNSSSTWTAKINCLSDMTIQELAKTHTGRLPPPPQEVMDRRSKMAEQELPEPLRKRRALLKFSPAFVDLASAGKVSPAKAQLGCGSCSVFAAVSTIESCMHRVTNVLPTDLSEQHMLDCAYGYQNNKGCREGSSDRYHEWMYREHNGGLSNEAQYPYRAATFGTSQCRNSTIPIANHGALVTGHQESWRSTEEEIMNLLAEGHSVTTGMQVVSSFYNHGSGVFQSSECQNCRNADGTVNRRGCPQNHDITIVGFGVENGVKYWKLKNSWGDSWGEEGFGKILRGTGHCGIGIDFSLPICTASGPAPPPTSAPLPTPAPPTPSAPSCRGVKLITGVGVQPLVITSPNFPGNYPDSTDCDWTISVPFGQKVKLEFKKFDTESTWDPVRFYDGRWMMGKYTGNRRPFAIESTGNQLHLTFTSDPSITRNGFRAIAYGVY